MPFLPTLGQGLVLPIRSPPPWAALLVVVSVAWLQLANLALPLLGHPVANGVALVLADLPELVAHFVARPVSFGILGLSFLVAGVFLLRRSLRTEPLPSLTTEAP